MQMIDQPRDRSSQDQYSYSTKVPYFNIIFLGKNIKIVARKKKEKKKGEKREDLNIQVT